MDARWLQDHVLYAEGAAAVIYMGDTSTLGENDSDKLLV
jgi:hypothetical protein